MSRKIARNEILSLKPYKAQPRDYPVVLDANESPYPLPANIKNAIEKNIDSIAFNRYPDPEGKRLKSLLSKFHNVDVENIVLGNGSDELILYLICAFSQRGYKVLYPVPTFSMYGIISQSLGQKKIEIPLNEKFDIDDERIIETAKKQKVSLIFFSYPNNPTGNCFSKKKIINILDNYDGITVIDEAYGDFSGKSFLNLVPKYKNLIISKTFSKIGLSSLRLGYLIANRDIAEIVEKVRLPFNVNSFSQGCGEIFLQKRKTVNKLIKKIINGRKFLYEELKKIKSLKVFPSEANFILFKAKDNSDAIHNELKKRGISIRNLNNPGLLQDCLRVTVGTEKENRLFVKELKLIIKKLS